MKKILFLPLFTCLLLAACKKDDSLTPEEQFTKDVADIGAYLADNNLTAQVTASGLHHIIEVEGTGGHPTLSSDISVLYKGYYLDGDVFDERAQPITFPLGQLLLGWQEGIQLLQKGGKGTFLLPSVLAYGSNPPAGVRKNAVMIFEIQLLDF